MIILGNTVLVGRRPSGSLLAYLREEDGGPLAIGAGLLALGTTAASLALRPKMPKPPTPPAPTSDITRPNSTFLSPGQGSFNGTYFGGAAASGQGAPASPGSRQTFGA